ncbi:sulfatase [Puniceicoccus vermicola]
MVMFDSLNRHMLPPYNPNTNVQAPNFQRLAEHSTTFDTSYVCSMPCMPARRDFHTGRPNFLHCNWGPIEPFDDSVPAMLRDSGVYSHLCTDHYHYFEEGGATYHTKYSSWEVFRGQEGDPWKGMVKEPEIPKNINGKGRRADWVNRAQLHCDADYPQSKTFEAGLEFIEQNNTEDNWFVQIECFDPHEPFTVDPEWQKKYPSPDIDGALFDWPDYADVTESPEEAQVAKNNYSALVSKCDASLGKILDAMDRHDMWKDTLLIVWTDHGYLLGEHGKWAKNWPITWEEIAHTPFFIADPRRPDTAGKRRSSLVQPSIDLGPTLLGYFGLDSTPDMTGKDLAGAIENDTPVRDAGIFGYHGQRMNITDGRYVYYSALEETGDIYLYTLLPLTMRGAKPNLETATLAKPFSFTKGMNTLKIGQTNIEQGDSFGRKGYLYDVQEDPTQSTPLDDPEVVERLSQLMAKLMRECDAPAEQLARVGCNG